MTVTVISILAGFLAYMLLGVIEGIFLGDRGRVKNISNHFAFLQGNEGKRQNVALVEGFEKNAAYSSDIKHKRDVTQKKRDYKLYAFVVSIAIFFLSLICFKSLMLAFILSLFGLMVPKTMAENSLKNKKEKLSLQFAEALNSIMSSLKAGLSINSAIIKCYEDLDRIYSNRKDRYIVEEFYRIKSDLSVGIPVDDALKRFKQRMDMEDVDDFVDSVVIIRQKGGNMIEIMENVVKMITDKISIKNEIKVATTQKKFEAKILTFVPIFLVLALSLFSPKYMEPLYGTLAGKILIILGFFLLTINYRLGKKITDINI